eukprot:jgi/Tetstr1/458409/TSEL_044845.t1
MEGWGVDNIHNVVKIMLYEGQDKYEQFITHMEAIKDQLMELCDGSGMKLHDEIYTFQMVLGGDMAWQSGIYGHAGAASTFFCFVCDMSKNHMHLTQRDYERKGMSMPIIKSAQYAAMLAHAMGDEYGLTEPYPCPDATPRAADFIDPRDWADLLPKACADNLPPVGVTRPLSL